MTQRVHVLRKSFGPYSAGTPVRLDTGTILGKNQMTTYELPNGMYVPEELVVQRRQRTFVIGS